MSSKKSSAPPTAHPLSTQFVLDAPRIAFYRRRSQLHPKQQMPSQDPLALQHTLHEWCAAHGYVNDTFHEVLDWCTQSGLAPVYKTKLAELQDAHQHELQFRWDVLLPPATYATYGSVSRDDDDETASPTLHLLDHGEQTVVCDDSTGAIHVCKPFRVVVEDHATAQAHGLPREEALHERETMELRVTLHPPTRPYDSLTLSDTHPRASVAWVTTHDPFDRHYPCALVGSWCRALPASVPWCAALGGCALLWLLLRQR